MRVVNFRKNAININLNGLFMCTINGTLKNRLLPFPQVGNSYFLHTPRIYAKKSIDLVPDMYIMVL